MNKKTTKHPLFDDVVVDHFKEHPEEIKGYLDTVIEEYEKNPDEGALLSALQQVAKANGGISELARKTDLSRTRLYETLSDRGNPRLKNFQRILKAFGYTLTIKPINDETVKSQKRFS